MEHLLRRIEEIAMWTAGIALLVMGAIVTTSVIGRVLFNMPVPDDLIMAGLLMICTIILPLAFIEASDGHIAVTVIADRLPVRVQAVLRMIGALLFAAFFGTIGFMIATKVPGEYAEELYYDGQLEIPTWPMKAVFAFGVAVFVVRLAVTFVRYGRIARHGVTASPPHSIPDRHRRVRTGMEPLTIGLIALPCVLVLLVLRIPIAAALGVVASIGIFVIFAWRPGQAFQPEWAWVPTLSLLTNSPYAFHNQLHSFHGSALHIHGAPRL